MAKRILIWFWSGGGGGSQFAMRLAQRLTVQFGAGAVTLSMREDDPTIVAAEAAGVRVLRAHVVSDRRKPAESMAGLGHSAAVLAEHARGADAVIVPMNFATAAPLAFSVRQPLVYCAHDPEPHEGDYEVHMQRLMQSALMRRAQTIVTHSTFAAGLIGKNSGLRQKLRLAPLNSVFEPKQPLPPRAPGPTRLLFVGRMIAYKGLGLLADALDHIADRDDWRLTVAGYGPALTDAAARRYERPQVEEVHRGVLSDAEIDAMMARTDVMLAPYREASQSGVVAEALAWGKPSVVTPVGALAEQIGEGRAGWIADAVTPGAFAAALRQALDDAPARAAKAQGAAAIARAAWESDSWGWLQSL